MPNDALKKRGSAPIAARPEFSHLVPTEAETPSFVDRARAARRIADGHVASPKPGSFAARLAAVKRRIGMR